MPLMSWIFIAIRSISNLKEPRPMIRLLPACCAAGRPWGCPISSRWTMNSVSAVVTAIPDPWGSFYDYAFITGSNPFLSPLGSPGEMERWNALTIPTTTSSFADSGFRVTKRSNARVRTSSGSITSIIDIVASKGKPLWRCNHSGYQPVKLAPNTKLPELDYIPSGNVILIRFIRSDRKLDVFGEKFFVSKDLVYSYVKALIITDCHIMNVFLHDELVETFEYQMPMEKWQKT